LQEPILKNPSQKRTGEVAQGEGLSSSPSTAKKKKKKIYLRKKYHGIKCSKLIP
jgi:hypothetical protein